MMQSILDLVEKIGNKVPHPAIIFLAVIGIVINLSVILCAMGTSFNYEVIVPMTEPLEPNDVIQTSDYDTGTEVTYQRLDQKHYTIKKRSVTARSLLTSDGIRFIYSSLIPNFMGFTAVGLMIVALVGAGQYEIHTINEYVDLPEFFQGCRLAVALATQE